MSKMLSALVSVSVPGLVGGGQRSGVRDKQMDVVKAGQNPNSPSDSDEVSESRG